MRAPCARSTRAPSCSVVSTGPSTGSPSPCSTPPPYGSRGTEITSGGSDTTRWYGEDIAYIHDVGHAEFALRSAPGILEILDRNGIHDGLIVDLGCGSGLWARELVDAGYRVLGIDISDAENEKLGLGRLFRRVHDELVPGGVFVFDVLSPGQVPLGARTQGFSVGEDWAVLSELEEDDERGTMERRIVSFRKVGELYRRDDEVHPVRLYDPAELSSELERAGFRIRTLRSYGDFPLSGGHTAF